MYIPDHFRPTDADVRALLANIGAADLVTATAEGLLATMLPLIYEPPGTTGTTGMSATPGEDGTPGEHGRLMGHLARPNRQWKLAPIGEALVIVRGPDAYISPAWYATKQEHGRVVPTWNYITAHLHGRLVVHDDPAWVESNVRALSDRHEATRADPWSVDDAPPPYIAGQLKAIVGVEIQVTRIEAKFKLGQNRSIEDIDGAIAGLEGGATAVDGATTGLDATSATSEAAVARAMRAASARRRL